MGSKKSFNGGIIIAVMFIAIIFVIIILMKQAATPVSQYKYSEILTYFDNYKVSKYDFDLGTGKLNMTVNKDDGTTEEIAYTVPNVSLFLNEIQSDVSNYRREYNKLHPDAPLEMEYYKIQDTSWLYNILPTVLVIILMVALFIFMMRQATGGGKINSFRKANIKSNTNSKTTFADVAGADEEKEELEEIVDFLKQPKKYTELGARIPKGVLLMGPPGTGKTLLAKAVAGEAGVPFFSISGSDFVELYVGVGASRVRDLFDTAKKNAPAIIFIDEIDAVGRHRGAGMGGGHDEREQTLNQLLVEMDGFEGNEGIIVMAATNRKDILDPALLRPGRFDRQIVVNYPDIKGREEILKVHTKKKPLAPDVDLNVIAKTTQGFTGADLENLMNEAALLAARAGRKAIVESDIEEATLKVWAGPEKKSHIVTEHDKKITAFHEAGHAIAAYYLETQERVHQVTVIQRGMAAGITVTRPDNDNEHVSRRKMQENLIMLLGGRAAESIALDDICTGASNDIERATKIATNMVTRYGFSEKIGNVVYGSDSDEIFIGRDYGHTKSYSERVASEIDDEVKQLIDGAYEQCRTLLQEHFDQLSMIAECLIKYEKIDGDDFYKLMSGEIPDKFPDLKPAAEKDDNNEMAENTENNDGVSLDKENKSE